MRYIDETVKFVEDRPGYALGIAGLLGFMGLGRLARLAAMGVAAVWLVDQIKEIEGQRAAADFEDEKVDTNGEDSFPASDAPSTSASTAGSPAETDG